MDWFRSWHGAPTDNKWLAVTRAINEKRSHVTNCASLCVTRVTAVTWALLDHASQANIRGNISDFDVAGYACWAAVPDQDILDIIAELHQKKVLKDNGFSNWVKRQSSDGADRMRKLRERRKSENVTDVTERASHVTTDKIRLDSNTPHSKSRDNHNISSHSLAFEKFWSHWRPFEMVKGGKPPAQKSYAKVIASGVSSEILLTAADRYCRNCHHLRTKTQHVSTWLNQRGWEGIEDLKPTLDPSMRMPSPAGG